MKKVIKISIALLMILKSLFLFAQTSHKDYINNLCTLLAKEDRMPIGGDMKFDSKIATLLNNIATQEELISLTKYPSPIVRVYSIYYLTQFYSNLPFIELINEHLNDLETVQLMQWQRYSDSPVSASYITKRVGDLFVTFIGSTYVGCYPFEETVGYIPYLKDTTDLQKIDSLLICTPNKLKQTENLLCWSSAKENYYRSVRNQVLEKQSPDAVVYLSKYQKSKDVDLILNSLPVFKESAVVSNKYFSIFNNFHNPKMFRHLSDNLGKFYQYPSFLNAVAGYKNEDALLLIHRTLLQINTDSLNKERKYYVTQIITNALKQNFTKIYAPFLFELLEANPNSLTYVPTDLWKIDSNRTYQYLLKCINSSSMHNNRRTSTFEMVFGILQKDAPNYIDDLLSNHLQPNLSWNTFNNIMKYKYASKDEKDISLLIEILKTEKDKVASHLIVKILKSYNMPSATQQLEKLFTEHPELIPSQETEGQANNAFLNLKHEVSRMKK